MIDARFRPMADPKIHKTRKSSTFRASYAKTLELLEGELWHLRATDIVIEAGFTLDQIRNDGWDKSFHRLREGTSVQESEASMSKLPRLNEELAAYIALTKDILDAAVELYPNDAWTGPAPVLNHMVAEIKILREELRKERLSLQ